ncbi:disulfide bond formation protein DsbA, partial [Priestia megaterium]|uniref:DsbA family oxidoreductase n=1 Tax=Priestia megaterium TaxID=1404 RepID=UPI000C01C57A
MSEPIKIDIWSDISCPWCYIGKRKFEAGSGLFSGAGEGRDVEVEYHSFELSPDTPVDFDGSEIDFLAGHKGIPAAQVEQMLERVTGIASSVGLEYDYDNLQHTNTVK